MRIAIMNPGLGNIGMLLCVTVIIFLDEAAGSGISSTNESIQRIVIIEPEPMSLLGMCMYEPSVFKATIYGLRPPLTVSWFEGGSLLEEEQCSNVEATDPERRGIIISTCTLNMGDKNGWTDITCRASNSTREVSGNLCHWHYPALRNLFCPLVFLMIVGGALYFLVVICAVGYSLFKKYRRIRCKMKSKQKSSRPKGVELSAHIYQSIPNLSSGDAALLETLREAVTSFNGKSPPVKPHLICSVFNNDEGDYLLPVTDESSVTSSCLMDQHEGMDCGASSVEQLYDSKGKRLPIYVSTDNLFTGKPIPHAPVASPHLYENWFTVTDKSQSIVPLLTTDEEGYLLPTRKDHLNPIYENYSQMVYEMLLEQKNHGRQTDRSISPGLSKIWSLSENKPRLCPSSVRCKKLGVRHSPTAISQSTVPLLTTDAEGYILPTRKDHYGLLKHERYNKMDYERSSDQFNYGRQTDCSMSSEERLGNSDLAVHQSKIWSVNEDKPRPCPSSARRKKPCVGHSPTAASKFQSTVPLLTTDDDGYLLPTRNDPSMFPHRTSKYKHNRQIDWWTNPDQHDRDSKIPAYHSQWSLNGDKRHANALLSSKKHLVGNPQTAYLLPHVPSFKSYGDGSLLALQKDWHIFPSPSVKRSRCQVRTFSAKATYFTFPRSLSPVLFRPESKQRSFERSFSPDILTQEPQRASFQRSPSPEFLTEESKQRSFPRTSSPDVVTEEPQKTHFQRPLSPAFLKQESKQRSLQRSLSPILFRRECQKSPLQRPRSAPILIQRVKKTYL